MFFWSSRKRTPNVRSAKPVDNPVDEMAAHKNARRSQLLRDLQHAGGALMGVRMRFLAVALALGLSACTSSVVSYSLDRQGALAELREGVTTRQQAVEALGQPYDVITTLEGVEGWTFAGLSGSTNGAENIPVLGIFAGAVRSTGWVAWLSFGEDGQLLAVETASVDGYAANRTVPSDNIYRDRTAAIRVEDKLRELGIPFKSGAATMLVGLVPDQVIDGAPWSIKRRPR